MCVSETLVSGGRERVHLRSLFHEAELKHTSLTDLSLTSGLRTGCEGKSHSDLSCVSDFTRLIKDALLGVC